MDVKPGRRNSRLIGAAIAVTAIMLAISIQSAVKNGSALAFTNIVVMSAAVVTEMALMHRTRRNEEAIASLRSEATAWQRERCAADDTDQEDAPEEKGPV